MKKQIDKFKRLSLGKKLVLGSAAIVVLAAAGSSSQKDLNVQPTAKTIQSSVQAEPKPPVTTEKLETETQTIPFTATTVESSSLAEGTSKVTTPGVDGVKTITYKVTYSDGVKTNSQKIKEEVTTPPVDQVTTVGTYVAPASSAVSCSGGYINVDGNCIPSPSSNPSGATARCADGSYSYSQHRSGTCSHHGGVAAWL